MKLVSDGHGNLTYRILGACMDVHNDIGPGHREEVYQRALAQKLRDIDIAFDEEPPLTFADGNGNVLVIYRPDFCVDGCVWVELKAFSHLLTEDEMAQVIDYFAADVERRCDVALLVNFGRPRLDWQRLFPPKEIATHLRKRWTADQKAH